MSAADARFRSALESFVQAAIDWMDERDARGEDREDDEREVVCEDDGVVDAETWEAWG